MGFSFKARRHMERSANIRSALNIDDANTPYMHIGSEGDVWIIGANDETVYRYNTSGEFIENINLTLPSCAEDSYTDVSYNNDGVWLTHPPSREYVCGPDHVDTEESGATFINKITEVESTIGPARVESTIMPFIPETENEVADNSSERINDYNVDIVWREYPIHRYGAHWTFDDPDVAGTRHQVRLHVSHILQSLYAHHVTGDVGAVDIWVTWNDFAEMFDLPISQIMRIRRSIQWGYELDRFLENHYNFPEGYTSADVRAILGELPWGEGAHLLRVSEIVQRTEVGLGGLAETSNNDSSSGLSSNYRDQILDAVDANMDIRGLESRYQDHQMRIQTETGYDTYMHDYNRTLFWELRWLGDWRWYVPVESDTPWQYDRQDGTIGETDACIWQIIRYRMQENNCPPWSEIHNLFDGLSARRLREIRNSLQWLYEINRYMHVHDLDHSHLANVLGAAHANQTLLSLIAQRSMMLFGVNVNVPNGVIDGTLLDQIPVPDPVREPLDPISLSDGILLTPALENDPVSNATNTEEESAPDTPESFVFPYGNQAKRKFGVEIELLAPMAIVDVCQAINESGITCRSESYNHRRRSWWKIVTDASVSGSINGVRMNPMEIVSRPLKDNYGLIEAENVIRILNSLECGINVKCGLHVHVEASRLRVDQLQNVSLAWLVYEHVIESMIPHSRRHNNSASRGYCKSIIGCNGSDNYSKERLIERISATFNKRRIKDIMNPHEDRFFKFNLQSLSRHGTIEFRHHGGTCNAEKILNHIRFCIAFVEHYKNNRVNIERDEIDCNLESMLSEIVTVLPNRMHEYFKAYYQRRISELAA